MDILWKTKQRLDGSPVANVYHFVTDAAMVFQIREERRPKVTFTLNEKVVRFYASELYPEPLLPGLTRWSERDQQYLWRLSPEYATPADWFEEVARIGEACFWLPNRKIVEHWVSVGFRPHIFVAHPIKGTDKGSVIAVVRPQWAAYPVNEDTDLIKAEALSKWAYTYAQSRIKLANVIFPENNRTFTPLHSIL